MLADEQEVDMFTCTTSSKDTNIRRALDAALATINDLNSLGRGAYTCHCIAVKRGHDVEQASHYTIIENLKLS